jgi:hypothetical protein
MAGSAPGDGFAYRPEPDPLIEAFGPTFTRAAGLETDATGGSLDELAKTN